MSVKKPIALCGATLAVAVASVSAAPAIAVAPQSAASAAAGTNVTVRIEGQSKTLLASTPAKTHGGSIRKNHTPKGQCPATSAAGALDVATNHDWSGHYDKGLGLEITSILGETHKFSSKYFWELFVNNVAANFGACQQTLHRGDKLLFAAVPQKGFEYPIVIRSPRRATVNHVFNVHVVYYNARGKAKALNHALVTVHGKSVRTKANGIVGIKWGSKGTIVITASRRGYIRPAPVSVHVSG